MHVTDYTYSFMHACMHAHYNNIYHSKNEELFNPWWVISVSCLLSQWNVNLSHCLFRITNIKKVNGPGIYLIKLFTVCYAKQSVGLIHVQ